MIDIHPVDNKNCCCISNGLLLPTAIDIHPMDNKNCCCTSNLLPENVLVEKGGYYSPNSVIQDIMAFSHVLLNMSFLCQATSGRGFFSISMEFFDASPFIVPRQVSNSIKKKKTREGVGYMSAPARGADILVNT